MSIESLHEELLHTEAHADDLRAARDEAIRKEIHDGVTMYSIAKRLDITQQSVRDIRDKG